MNKKLIAILTLVMFAITLLPMGAFAASKNTATGFLPTVTGTGNATMASIRISQDDITDNFVAGVFTVDLPSGIEWDSTAAAANITAAIGGSTATRSSARTMTIGLATVPAATGSIVIPVRANVTSVGTGDITATITDISTGITGGDVVIGKFSRGSASIKALGTSTTGDSAATLGTIRITENSPGALVSGETIKLTLPSNVTWNAGVNTTVVTGNGSLLIGATGDRSITFTVATTSTAVTVIDIQTRVNIDSDAKYGDITVSVGGNASVDSTTLTIGKYADFSAKVSAAEPKDIYAGKAEQAVATVTIEEGLKGSILANRDITFTLPSGVKFATTGGAVVLPNLTTVKGSPIIPAPTAASFNSDRDKMTLRPTPLSATATKVEIKDIKLDVAANYVGDVVIKVSGPAGVTGDIVVANVKKPVTLETAGATTLKMGVQAQKLGDLFVTELVKEALIDGASFTLTLPTGSTWSKIPTVEVVEGDVEIGTVTRNGAVLTVPVDTESTVVSKIKFSGIEVTTDRTIAEGDVEVSLAGAAVVETNFTNRNTAAKIKVATLTTPAEDGVVQPVVMTVGSTVYTIDGVEMTMDVAPYIKDGRTYFPVRYVAQALGITADNVVWDGAQRTVTIFRANRIVQVTIGSTTMLVNGVPLTMDVAPEITAERTMLPIRFVAQGLGVNVNWDAATQTVTLN